MTEGQLKPVIHVIEGLRPSDLRGVVFLTCDTEKASAKVAFDSLKLKQKRTMLDRFDYWISGGKQDKYFHGWPNDPKFKECFVFKLYYTQQWHRFYGFLCHPQPASRPRFQVCVLCSHAIKAVWETDPNELQGADALRVDPRIGAAIAMIFPDKQSGADTCRN